MKIKRNYNVAVLNINIGPTIIFVYRFKMNESLKILDILTKQNLIEDFLKKEILDEGLEGPEVKLALLFRRYYGVYAACEEEMDMPPVELINKIVALKRKNRFENDKYWSIWKEDGLFFGFMEGFFHAQEGKNQLCKIRGRKINEDFLLTNFRQSEIKKKFKIENQIEYFKNPDVFAFRFQTLEEFRVFLRINKIERMVAKRENTPKGMHFNIYNSALKIAGDENLKQIFEGTGTGRKLFDSERGISKVGLMAVLGSFSGYGPKISKMVMNLVFDVGIIAVDRRVLRSSLSLSLVSLNAAYLHKITSKYGIKSEKEMRDKISALSEKYPLLTAETNLNSMFANSPFLSEVDYLLFMYNGGDGWNPPKDKEESAMCRLGKCCFDENGVCLLRRKMQYAEQKDSPSTVSTFRYA